MCGAAIGYGFDGPFEEIKYLFTFIFSLPRFGVKAKLYPAHRGIGRGNLVKTLRFPLSAKFW